MALSNQQRDAVEAVFIDFMKNCFKKLRGLRLDDIIINPFLARLVARTPLELASFITNQRWNRSAVTSMGFKLQNVSREVATIFRSSGVAGADLEADDPDLKRLSLMQLKSGPDTVNKDIRDNIQNKLQAAERRVRQGGLPPDYVVVKMLGMCYGRPEHRSNWVKSLGDFGFDIDAIGRKFWYQLTGDPDAHIEIFNIAAHVATTYKNNHGKTLPDVVEQLKQNLEQEIEARYGDGQGEIAWNRLLEDFM
jgi:Type II restriction endonuclease EcoO109I